MTDEQMKPPIESRIVYIRAVDPEEIPEPARSQAGTDHFYAIHDAQGNRLAVTTDRSAAFRLARENAMTPLSAH
ncbi:MAG: DUF1150 family protein [Rubrimonas sp.]|uniref:DUF1150 family protein n=1 Tax=Rubrimonas sp. TaxID=2036015 RepID=UPI002FDDFF43